MIMVKFDLVMIGFCGSNCEGGFQGLNQIKKTVYSSSL